jgi:RHS repeat-associated protein
MCPDQTVNHVTGSDPSPVTFVYSAMGDLVAEYGTAGVSSGTQFLHADALGSTRLVTEAGEARRRFDYRPFGEELTVGQTSYRSAALLFGSGEPKLRFTGKERDAETGLDYFGARYLSSAQGRFTSPDLPLYAQHPAEPQSWNLYSYTANNPLARIDPDGRNWFSIGGTWQWHKGANVTSSGEACEQGSKGCIHSDYTHLLVVTSTGTDRQKGAAKFQLTLYNQDRQVYQGEGYSGGRDSEGNMHPAIDAGNYLMRTDIRDEHGPRSYNDEGNPPAQYGIQMIPNEKLPGPRGLANDPYLIYGPIRLRLAPADGKRDRGLYLHGDPQNACATFGCLSYGNRSDALPRYLWNLRPLQKVPLAVDRPVRRP